MLASFRWATLVVLFVGQIVFASGKQNCDKALDSIPTYGASKKMYSELYGFFQKYGSCMDGGIAEGAAAVTTEALAKSWNQVGDLNRILKKDPSFKKFVLGNIAPRVTGQETEVAKIIEQATKTCPSNLKLFCQELVKVSRASLKPED